ETAGGAQDVGRILDEQVVEALVARNEAKSHSGPLMVGRAESRVRPMGRSDRALGRRPTVPPTVRRRRQGTPLMDRCAMLRPHGLDLRRVPGASRALALD